MQTPVAAVATAASLRRGAETLAGRIMAQPIEHNPTTHFDNGVAINGKTTRPAHPSIRMHHETLQTDRCGGVRSERNASAFHGQVIKIDVLQTGVGAAKPSIIYNDLRDRICIRLQIDCSCPAAHITGAALRRELSGE